MKQLSQVLENTLQHGMDGQKEISNTSLTQQHGLISADGMKNQSRREVPLTSSQIMKLESKMQSNIKSISPEIEKVWVAMDYESTGLDGRFDYKETGRDVITLLPELDNESLNLALAALRKGSNESIANHIGRLALHKKIAKESSAGMAVLINDYVENLKDFAELAIIHAINEVITSIENPFFPQLATLINIVQRKQANLEDYYFALADAMNKQIRLESKSQTQTRESEEADVARMNELTRKADKKNWYSHEWEAYIKEPKTMSDSLKLMNMDTTHWDNEYLKRVEEKRKIEEVCV